MNPLNGSGGRDRTYDQLSDTYLLKTLVSIIQAKCLLTLDFFKVHSISCETASEFFKKNTLDLLLK